MLWGYNWKISEYGLIISPDSSLLWRSFVNLSHPSYSMMKNTGKELSDNTSLIESANNPDHQINWLKTTKVVPKTFLDKCVKAVNQLYFHHMVRSIPPTQLSCSRSHDLICESSAFQLLNQILNKQTLIIILCPGSFHPTIRISRYLLITAGAKKKSTKFILCFEFMSKMTQMPLVKQQSAPWIYLAYALFNGASFKYAQRTLYNCLVWLAMFRSETHCFA